MTDTCLAHNSSSLLVLLHSLSAKPASHISHYLARHKYGRETMTTSRTQPYVHVEDRTSSIIHFCSLLFLHGMQHNRETKEFQKEGRTLKKLCSKRSKKIFFLIKSFYPFSYINPCKHWRYVWCQSWQPLVSPKHAERSEHSCSTATLPPARKVKLQVCAPAAIACPAPSSTRPKESFGSVLWVVHLRQRLLQGNVWFCHNGGKRDGRKAHGREHSILAPFKCSHWTERDRG